MTGTRLAHYEIRERLGAGGMGVVYRARDTKLERDVAVKVVGEGSDELARQRLMREARTASAPNHPNICTIYEVGETEGQTYILMWLAYWHIMNGDATMARTLLERVLQRDPVFFAPRWVLGELLRCQGDLEGALREHHSVLEPDPANPVVQCAIAREKMDAGDLAGARQCLEAAPAPERSLLRRAYYGLLLALEGKREEALAAMDEQVLAWLGSNAAYAAQAAVFFAVLGETARALDWLDRAVGMGDERAEYFARDPLLANLREHPRFRQILASIEWRRKQRAKP
jgi:tetratricopeptide (TPR) repeat protein